MRSRMRTGVIGAALAAVMVSSVAFTGTAHAHPPHKGGPGNDVVHKLVKAVSGKNVKKHLKAFQAIADANGGTRVSGTPGFDASRDYVAGKLRAAGYDVTIQPFEFTFDGYLTPPLLRLDAATPKTYRYGFFSDFVAMNGAPAGSASGQIQPVDLTLPPPETPGSTSGCEASDFDGFVPGRIALIQRGTCTFREKVDNATAAGAAGVIVFNEGQEGRTEIDLNPDLGGPGTTIPSFFTSFAVGQELAAAAGTQVTLNWDPIVETRTAYNVIAETRQGDPDNVVMLGAHLDGVQEGPGINDNGSGSAGVLEVALQFAKLHKLDKGPKGPGPKGPKGPKDPKGHQDAPQNKVRFAFWGAEEFGLIGSRYYVDTLPEEERAKIALYLNFDMIASPNYTYGIYDGDGDAFGTAGPEGSAQIEEDFEKFFADRGLPYTATAFTGRSDYGPFIAVGIPSGGLFTGAEELKTEEEAAIFGGTAGIPLDPCYHQACDDITNISDTALDVNSDAIATLTAKYAYDTGAISAGARTATAARAAARGATAHTHGPAPAQS